MNQECIGTNAGKVWNALNVNNDLSLKALKKETKLKDKDLYLALGWLAREGKITFIEENDLVISELIEA